MVSECLEPGVSDAIDDNATVRIHPKANIKLHGEEKIGALFIGHTKQPAELTARSLTHSSCSAPGSWWSVVKTSLHNTSSGS